jgi:hypothetical protein
MLQSRPHEFLFDFFSIPVASPPQNCFDEDRANDSQPGALARPRSHEFVLDNLSSPATIYISGCTGAGF